MKRENNIVAHEAGTFDAGVGNVNVKELLGVAASEADGEETCFSVLL